MNKCRATGHRKYAFPDPCVIVYFSCCDTVGLCTTTSHNIEDFCFSHHEQVYRTQRVCVSGPKCNNLFFSCCDMDYHLSLYWTLLVLATMNKSTELRKYAFPDPSVIIFSFHVVICTTTSHNIGHFWF